MKLVVSILLVAPIAIAAPCDDLRELMTGMGLRMPTTNLSCCALRGIGCNPQGEITRMYTSVNYIVQSAIQI